MYAFFHSLSHIIIRDIARIYENRVQISMLESVLHDLIIENLKGGIYFSARTKEIAQWAQEVNLYKYVCSTDQIFTQKLNR